MSDEFEKVSHMVAQLAQSVQAQNEQISTLARSIAQGNQAPAARPPEPAPVLPKFDEMDNQSLAKWILGAVNESMSGLKSELTETVEGVNKNVQRQNIGLSVKELGTKYADFDEWKTEIADLIEKKGVSDLETAYKLARLENEDKAKELDEKTAEPAAPPVYLGMHPTSGIPSENGAGTEPYNPNVPVDTGKPARPNVDDAITLAMKELQDSGVNFSELS